VVEVEDKPVQRVANAVEIPLNVINLDDFPPDEREAEAMRRASEEARRPFCLSQCPLARVSIMQLGSDEWLLVLVVHHVIADGWSVGVFNRELATLYLSNLSGTPRQLPALPVRYADFAIWQHRLLKEELLAPQLEYWRKQLAGAPPALELVTDR